MLSLLSNGSVAPWLNGIYNVVATTGAGSTWAGGGFQLHRLGHANPAAWRVPSTRTARRRCNEADPTRAAAKVCGAGKSAAIVRLLKRKHGVTAAETAKALGCATRVCAPLSRGWSNKAPRSPAASGA